MPAFAVAHVTSVTVGPDIVEYIERIDDTLGPFGGRFVVHGGAIEVLEGEWVGHLIAIEFQDFETARRRYHSPAYQRIVALRTQSSTGVCILVDGVSANHRAADILADLVPIARGDRKG